jgi:hypothetical protein
MAPQDREPFITREDRPEAQLHLDMPLGELRVRDLLALLGGQAALGKAHKPEKLELGLKAEKVEKFEQIKSELGKLEHAEMVQWMQTPERAQGDPRIDELAQRLTRLQRDVAEVKANIEAERSGRKSG